MSEFEQHHVKYKELHGEDEIVMLTHAEHRQLHARLRREGKCNVPADELEKVSDAARRRSPRGRKYAQSDERKLAAKIHRQSELGRQTANKHEAYRQSIRFDESFGKYTLFREHIRYNHETGSVGYTAGFQARQGHTLLIVEVS